MASLESNSTPYRKAKPVNNAKDRARLEVELARAHRALWNAQAACERLDDVHGHDRLYELQIAVGELMERSLKPRPNRPIKGELDLSAALRDNA